MFLIDRTKKPILDLIENSEEFIKIVSFQFSDPEIIDKLIKKADNDIHIEVITLPIDSIDEKERQEKMSNCYKNLKEKGAELYENRWEIGDPTLTDTSVSGEVSEGGGG